MCTPSLQTRLSCLGHQRHRQLGGSKECDQTDQATWSHSVPGLEPCEQAAHRRCGGRWRDDVRQFKPWADLQKKTSDDVSSPFGELWTFACRWWSSDSSWARWCCQQWLDPCHWSRTSSRSSCLQWQWRQPVWALSWTISTNTNGNVTCASNFNTNISWSTCFSTTTITISITTTSSFFSATTITFFTAIAFTCFSTTRYTTFSATINTTFSATVNTTTTTFWRNVSTAKSQTWSTRDDAHF